MYVSTLAFNSDGKTFVANFPAVITLVCNMEWFKSVETE